MSLSHKHQCREIITKAICGKGRKFSTVTHTVTPPNNPTSILGAWIINHQYEAVAAGDGIEVIGTYDVNIWYSYDKNSQTDVAKETVSYVERVPLSYLDPKHRASTVEVSAEATQEPSCVEASVSSNGTSVILRVEREFAVELVAETKVVVKVCSHHHGDYEDKEFDYVLGDGDDDYEDLDYEGLEDEL
ncbi:MULTISPECIES: outer spore coat protein CotE [Paenibacillus]|uniref:Spore coat protein CotE n=2 Tax=Paenibacillus lactis TaxID=228574 RepID=G4HFL6_9BACL|nr:outer spore coat protein CotE [Paenibacillus lactis]EHB64533.1 Spore coat protein CotE [Paenibacillus lactis 154]MBP1892769.1 spore coat protein E [Paenibacillus lactis]MCM3495082.1 outer spore coat protein CotE [Paenibacillus lactis]GIO91710.1 spore coat protein E [Paenibacillus lactis]HAF97248.1 outer spore coat protein CotE [Paenibacillus lactis]